MPNFIEGKLASASTHMTQKDSLQAFQWGLKKAASRARELAEAQGNPAWMAVAKTLDAMLHNGNVLANRKPMTELEIEMATDKIKERLATRQ